MNSARYNDALSEHRLGSARPSLSKSRKDSTRIPFDFQYPFLQPTAFAVLYTVSNEAPVAAFSSEGHSPD